MRPNGREQEQFVEREFGSQPAVDAAYIEKEGGKLTGEVLITGQVSVACEFNDSDIAIEVCPNGPEVTAAVDKMLANAASAIRGFGLVPVIDKVRQRVADAAQEGEE